LAYLVESLADFVTKTTYDDLSDSARNHVKIPTLDSLGFRIGALALGANVIHVIQEQVKDFDGSNHFTLIGGGKTSPRTGRLFSMAPWFATWIFMTVIWPEDKPATPAIIYLPFWLPVNTVRKMDVNILPRWPQLTRFNAA